MHLACTVSPTVHLVQLENVSKCYAEQGHYAYFVGILNVGRNLDRVWILAGSSKFKRVKTSGKPCKHLADQNFQVKGFCLHQAAY